MSNSNLTKKLLPLRKALKNIKNNFHLKSYSSKIGSIIQSARKRCGIFTRSISRLIYTNFRSLTNSPRHSSDHYHHSNQNFSVVYIDELFQGRTLLAEHINIKENTVPSSSSCYVQNRSSQVIETTHDVSSLHVNVESSTKHETSLPVGKGIAKSGEISNNPAAADKWKIPSLPQFRGIDERAEEFIAKFRLDMKLQREQSILDFEEMLKRSV
ncbi:hypothetical protein F511_16287 [Dorcoceras hygrometricum]|uniref:Uncharacterized protein n=1 Tax=Dorcoceras hygrometricum TaxID=472368 RepID=A0A2Z7BH39_9LAMI|nr:hypothetical protein F511_16287 [Dorcoceras hygrometricum]